MKTYTGGQGYVYQYYFVGKRPAPAGTEYIFDVTSDRKTTFSVTVHLESSTVQQWASRHGRSLSDAEQYAAVKLRLFQGFDDIEDMRAQGRELTLDESALEASLSTLGVI
ncbi:MAG: hypothetical protein H0X25_05740 [Acidobacteriales bacterium]|nr:hypothetical protein [Terriglobales bacterium]